MTFILLYKTGMSTTITHDIFLLQNSCFKVFFGCLISIGRGAWEEKNKRPSSRLFFGLKPGDLWLCFIFYSFNIGPVPVDDKEGKDGYNYSEQRIPFTYEKGINHSCHGSQHR